MLGVNGRKMCIRDRRKIHGISEELMIAAGNEDGFYVYAADESTAPDTLGKLLEPVSYTHLDVYKRQI